MKKYKSLLLVLVILLLCGCSFKFTLKDKGTEVTTDKLNTDINLTFYNAAQKIIVNDLLDLVSVGTCGVENGLDFTNSNKLTLDNLTNDYKYSMAYYNLYGYGRVDQISKEDISDSYEYIFGIKPTLPNQFNVSFVWAGYGIETNPDFYSVVAGGGGCGGFSSSYLLDKYSVNDSNISIDVIYYLKYYTNDSATSSCIANKNRNESPDYKIDLNGNEITELDLQKVKDNKDKFTQYKFNFKLSNDHYIFDSVEKIN